MNDDWYKRFDDQQRRQDRNLNIALVVCGFLALIPFQVAGAVLLLAVVGSALQ